MTFLGTDNSTHKEPCIIHIKQQRRTQNSPCALIPPHTQLSTAEFGSWRTSLSSSTPAWNSYGDPAAALHAPEGAASDGSTS